VRLAAGLVLLCGVAAAGESPRSVQAFPGTTPVLDGRIDVAEWADATAIRGAQGWMSQMSPVRDAKDLSFTVWVKHDGRRLYFAFRVQDDVLYGIDTPRWLPPNNAKAHELSREGWPWFGDEVEILLDSRRAGQGIEGAAGDGGSWQMVCNLTKSRLGGVGHGGLLEGEPRSRAAAWETYSRWIRSGAMEAAVRPLPGGHGYEMEWAISFEPCLEIEPGRYYSTALGDRAFGLNLAVGDLDEPEKGRGNFGLFHHEEWWAGAKDTPTQLRSWGTLWIRTKPGRR
jgi:SSS family solute:Na+ symporter